MSCWSENEILFLKENYSIKGAVWCAENMNRSLEAIRNKASRLNLLREGEYRYHKVDIPKYYDYCCNCKQILPESNFYRKLKNGRYGKKNSNICRSCAREKSRRSYRKHCSSTTLRYKKNPEKKIYENTKTRAKKRNIEFTLVLEDIKIPKICPVLGIEIIPFSKSDNSPSIDRIDNSKGYVKGNIIIVSNKANRIKNNAIVDDLYKVWKFYSSLSL